MKSADFKILEAKKVPYHGEKEEPKSFRYKLKRFRNYLLFLLAYFAPSNRVRITINRWKGVNIADGVYIGTGVFIDNMYPEYVYIEENASVNANTMILTHFNPFQHFKNVLFAGVQPVVIKKGALVAVRSIITPGVTIGQNAIVSAGSVVDKDVADYTMVRGNPAKKVTEFEFLMK